MIKVIFFDFDGTISDAKRLAYTSLVRALRERKFEFDESKISSLLGNKMGSIIEELGINKKDIDSTRKLFYKYFIGGANNGDIKRCGSMVPLWELKKNYSLIVVSNAETKFLNASIKTLELEGLFEKVYGGEFFKSKDIFLKKLFKKMKISPKEVAYIGDRFSDVKYAREAGCISIAIHNKYSWSTLDLIKKENPDYIVRNFSELRRLIKKINN